MILLPPISRVFGGQLLVACGLKVFLRFVVVVLPVACRLSPKLILSIRRRYQLVLVYISAARRSLDHMSHRRLCCPVPRIVKAHTEKSSDIRAKDEIVCGFSMRRFSFFSFGWHDFLLGKHYTDTRISSTKTPAQIRSRNMRP